MSNRQKNIFFAAEHCGFDISVLYGGFMALTEWNYTQANYRNWIFYWNSIPGATVICDDQEYKIVPSQAILIPPHTTYSTRELIPMRHFYLHFTAPAPFDRVKRKIYIFPAGSTHEEFYQITENYSSLERMLFFRQLLYSYLIQIPKEAFLPANQTVMDLRVQKIISLMGQNISTPRNNHWFAKKAGISMDDLYALFLSETRLSPKHYFLNMRMEEARNLLLHTQNSIEEIASATGYTNRFHFSKAFQNFHSISPAAYRKINSGISV